MDFKLPLLGDVMTEGTLAKWLQPAGASVAAGSPLYELETDKVSLTVDAPESGVLERLVAEGETVPVGTVVGRLSAVGAVEIRASPAARRLAEELSVDLSKLDTGRHIREADVQAFAKAQAPPTTTFEIRATPAARALARQLSVDLTAMANSGRIREAHVQAYAATRAERSAPVAVESPGALTGRRRVIAERMRSSLQQSAQLTISMEVDMTAAVELRAQLKQLLPDTAQPTITDLVMRATALALGDHPRLNATLADGRLSLHDAVHMGLAVDADEGLIVPVIRNAHALPLAALAEESKRLTQLARDNQFGLDDLQGGTFTITGLGALGVDFFTPIINPPQVAISASAGCSPNSCWTAAERWNVRRCTSTCRSTTRSWMAPQLPASCSGSSTYWNCPRR